MSITAPPDAPWWRPARPALPPPTPDELAAVRARTEARRDRRRPAGRTDAVVAVGGVLVLVAFVGLFAVDMITDGTIDGSRWAILLVGGAQGLLFARRARFGLQVDENVRRRLERDGTVVSPAVEPVHSTADRTLALVAVSGLVLAVAGLVVVAGLESTVDAWARTACVASVTGLGLRMAWQIHVARPVGTSAVLRAVDGALRRQGLVLALVPGWFVATFSLTWVDRSVDGAVALLPLAGLAAAALVGVAVLARDDSWLLRDHRIATATPPPVWLSAD